MPLNRFQFANPFESPAATIERQLRSQFLSPEPDPEPEFPEAEIDDALRRAAMIRERLRRQGFRP